MVGGEEGVSRPTPRGEVDGSGRGGCLQAHTWGSLQAHTPGGCVPACTEADTPQADGYCCGRYASYWNAFLFTIGSFTLTKSDRLMWTLRSESDIFLWSLSLLNVIIYGPIWKRCRFRPNIKEPWKRYHFHFRVNINEPSVSVKKDQHTATCFSDLECAPVG